MYTLQSSELTSSSYILIDIINKYSGLSMIRIIKTSEYLMLRLNTNHTEVFDTSINFHYCNNIISMDHKKFV